MFIIDGKLLQQLFDITRASSHSKFSFAEIEQVLLSVQATLKPYVEPVQENLVDQIEDAE